MGKYIGLQSSIRSCEFTGRESILTTVDYDEKGNIIYPNQKNELNEIHVESNATKTANERKENLVYITVKITFKSEFYDISLNILHSWLVTEGNIFTIETFMKEEGDYIGRCSCTMLADAINGFEYNNDLIDVYKETLIDLICKSVEESLISIE